MVVRSFLTVRNAFPTVRNANIIHDGTKIMKSKVTSSTVKMLIKPTKFQDANCGITETISKTYSLQEDKGSSYGHW